MWDLYRIGLQTTESMHGVIFKKICYFQQIHIFNHVIFITAYAHLCSVLFLQRNGYYFNGYVLSHQLTLFSAVNLMFSN